MTASALVGYADALAIPAEVRAKPFIVDKVSDSVDNHLLIRFNKLYEQLSVPLLWHLDGDPVLPQLLTRYLQILATVDPSIYRFYFWFNISLSQLCHQSPRPLSLPLPFFPLLLQDRYLVISKLTFQLAPPAGNWEATGHAGSVQQYTAVRKNHHAIKTVHLLLHPLQLVRQKVVLMALKQTSLFAAVQKMFSWKTNIQRSEVLW